MNISLSDAAKLVGMSKNGIVKAIKNGKISGQKNVHGQWEVDPAELTRVYKPVETAELVSANKNAPVSDSEPNENMALKREVELQREQINLLRDQLADAKGREDKILKMMEEQIGTMRLISDQRDVKPTVEGRGLWARLFG
jgi:hypothetical protein